MLCLSLGRDNKNSEHAPSIGNGYTTPVCIVSQNKEYTECMGFEHFLYLNAPIKGCLM